MQIMRDNGNSFSQIGKAVGCSAENARRVLFRRTGQTGRQDRAEQRERASEARERLARRLKEAMRESPGSTLADVSARVGCTEAEARRLTSLADRKLLLSSPSKRATSRLQWTNDELLDVLREAQIYEFPLTGPTYDELVQIGEIKGPTRRVFFQRFGSWAAACAAAGVQGVDAVRETYHSLWSDEDLFEFVWQYLVDPRTDGSFAGYESWARDATGAPSGGTLRNRLGAWSDIRDAAIRHCVGDGVASPEPPGIEGP